ncbi:MAG: hypothetical protein LQ352_001087 [Teloschistes flavicans]|nr:MAG: hypothetical protein LQ352_001087 [Teloschistes flavicans]
MRSTLSVGQSICGPYGVNLNAPAIAAADTVTSSGGASALLVPSPTSAAAVDTSTAVNAATTPAPDASTSSSAMPVSPSDLSASISAPSAAPTSTSPSSTSSYIVYDTKSVIPSATIAHSSSAMTDATDTAQQMTSPTISYYANTTTNSSVAASSPIPYIGAAVTSRVQSTGMVLLAILGLCWGL